MPKHRLRAKADATPSCISLPFEALGRYKKSSE